MIRGDETCTALHPVQHPTAHKTWHLCAVPFRRGTRHVRLRGVYRASTPSQTRAESLSTVETSCFMRPDSSGDVDRAMRRSRFYVRGPITLRELSVGVALAYAGGPPVLFAKVDIVHQDRKDLSSPRPYTDERKDSMVYRWYNKG
jgi:hypothetical protein